MSTGVVTSFLAAFSSLSQVPTPLLGLCDCTGYFYMSAELSDAQMAGKISFLDLSVRLFPEEISI